MQEVPCRVLDLPKLKRIETYSCNISHLPSLVAKQHELPKELSDLYWLEELNLTYNNLKQLPDWLVNLKNLKELDISNNEIEVYPETIVKKFPKIKKYLD